MKNLRKLLIASLFLFYGFTIFAQTSDEVPTEIQSTADTTVPQPEIVSQDTVQQTMTETIPQDTVQQTMTETVPVIVNPIIQIPSESFFSKITAIGRGNSIIVRWQEIDHNKMQKTVLYRAKEPITESSILTADIIARLPTGTDMYTDKVPDSGTYYYAVMPELADGSVIFTYTPLQNTTTDGASTGIEATAIPAEVTAIDAQSKDNAIVIRYAVTVAGTRLILYRSTTPLTEPGNITNAVIVSVFKDTGVPFIDYPVPEIPCYYGLIDEEKIRTGTAQFVAEKNATTVPVYTRQNSVKKKSATMSMRSIPLPYLSISKQNLPERKKLDPETEKILKALIDKALSNQLPKADHEPYVFMEEQKNKVSGEEVLLLNIIKNSFAEKKWNITIQEMQQFLKLHRSESVTARAHFYLGESYYFSGLYREALTEFLFSRSLYYAQGQEWIQYTLNKLDIAK